VNTASSVNVIKLFSSSLSVWQSELDLLSLAIFSG
jgi:hypothetical protein